MKYLNFLIITLTLCACSTPEPKSDEGSVCYEKISGCGKGSKPKIKF